MKAAGLMLMLMLIVPPGPAVAGVVGGWTATAPMVRVAVPGKVYNSVPLLPGSSVAPGSRMDKVIWEYQSPPGLALRAWLCGGGHCVAVNEQRGHTTGFVGLDAVTPLYFRFALAPGEKTAVVIWNLQVMVNYR